MSERSIELRNSRRLLVVKHESFARSYVWCAVYPRASKSSLPDPIASTVADFSDCRVHTLGDAVVLAIGGAYFHISDKEATQLLAVFPEMRREDDQRERNAMRDAAQCAGIST